MAEPEGGRRRSRTAWFALLALGLLAVLASAVWAGTELAVHLLTALLVLVAVARAVLPAGAAGPLVVRSRALDVTACLVLAVLLVVVTSTVPTGP